MINRKVGMEIYYNPHAYVFCITRVFTLYNFYIDTISCVIFIIFLYNIFDRLSNIQKIFFKKFDHYIYSKLNQATKQLKGTIRKVYIPN